MLYQEHKPQFVSVSAPRACPLHTAPAARFQADGQCDETFGAAVSGPNIAISTAFGPNVASRALNGTAVTPSVGWWPAQNIPSISKRRNLGCMSPRVVPDFQLRALRRDVRASRSFPIPQSELSPSALHPRTWKVQIRSGGRVVSESQTRVRTGVLPDALRHRDLHHSLNTATCLVNRTARPALS